MEKYKFFSPTKIALSKLSPDVEERMRGVLGLREFIPIKTEIYTRGSSGEARLLARGHSH